MISIALWFSFTDVWSFSPVQKKLIFFLFSQLDVFFSYEKECVVIRCGALMWIAFTYYFLLFLLSFKYTRVNPIIQRKISLNSGSLEVQEKGGISRNRSNGYAPFSCTFSSIFSSFFRENDSTWYFSLFDCRFFSWRSHVTVENIHLLPFTFHHQHKYSVFFCLDNSCFRILRLTDLMIMEGESIFALFSHVWSCINMHAKTTWIRAWYCI